MCIRVNNEGKKTIQVGPGGVQLQIREKKGKKPQFHDYETVLKEHRKLFGGETFGIDWEGTFAAGEGIVIAEQVEWWSWETKALWFVSHAQGATVVSQQRVNTITAFLQTRKIL